MTDRIITILMLLAIFGPLAPWIACHGWVFVHWMRNGRRACTMTNSPNLKDYLTETVDNWARLGHPSLLERFVLRNGRAFAPTKRLGAKRRAKQCFGNATQYVMRHPTDAGYVEGFTIGDELPIAIHHAWVTLDGTDAMDPTLDAATHEYFGVAFPLKTLIRVTQQSGVYGLLDHGRGLNWQLMFEIDPELRAICESVKHNRMEAVS